MEEFYEDNPANLTEKELGILLNWKNFIKDKFLIYKQYKRFCAFLSQEKDNKVYGVIGLTKSFNTLLSYFPVLTETVLLPFKDKIVYDGYLQSYSLHFGKNIREQLKNVIKQIPVRLNKLAVHFFRR